MQNFWQPKLVVRTVRDYPGFHLETPKQQLPVKKVELNYHFTKVVVDNTMVVVQVVLYYGQGLWNRGSRDSPGYSLDF